MRLFKCARRARAERIADELAFPVQSRILAAWRAGRAEHDSFLPLLRRALLAAGAVAAVAIAFALAVPAMTEDFKQADVSGDADEVTAITRSLNEAIEVAMQ